jgi:hypothetical protein
MEAHQTSARWIGLSKWDDFKTCIFKNVSWFAAEQDRSYQGPTFLFTITIPQTEMMLNAA